MSSFRMHGNWEERLRREVASSTERTAQRLQTSLDEVADSYGGRPIDEVKDELAAAWASATDGGTITDPELSTSAAVISRGGRLRIENGRLIAYEADEL
ncbi:hypothetical protein [Gordonia sp. NPDC003585]|uniref:hypothetical protein n=1 Tax=Gordonia sp. NPDC003585 TaxID=3154275 RepID=UPI0033BABA7A